MSSNATWVVLLRAINVGGNRRVPMAGLREIADELGYRDVATYLNSGNLIGSRETEASTVRIEFEDALKAHFGFDVEVVVRTSEAFAALPEDNPFPDAALERPNLVHVVFGVEETTSKTTDSLASYLSDNERAEVVSGNLWIDYADGSARSKVSHNVLRQAFDGIVTARNLKTVRRLSEMVSAGKS